MEEEVLKSLDFNHFTTKELASDVKMSGLYSKDRIIERMHELCETNERECHFKSLYCKQKSLKQRNSFATKGHAGLVSFNFKQKVR